MTRGAVELHPHRADATMREYRFTARWLSHDDIPEAVIALQESRDASWIVGFLITAEEQRQIARRELRDRQQPGRRTLDVASP